MHARTRKHTDDPTVALRELYRAGFCGLPSRLGKDGALVNDHSHTWARGYNTVLSTPCSNSMLKPRFRTVLILNVGHQTF